MNHKPLRSPASQHARTSDWFRRAAASSVVIATAALGGCYSSTNADRAPFSEVTREPTAIEMPSIVSPTPSENGTPTRKAQKQSSDPCAESDTIIAACLDSTTALVSFGPNRALVATKAADIFLVSPGRTPQLVINSGAPVKQFLASPTVTEDGQIYILREDNTIARLTIVTTGSLHTDIREAAGVNGAGHPRNIFRRYTDSKQTHQRRCEYRISPVLSYSAATSKLNDRHYRRRATTGSTGRWDC